MLACSEESTRPPPNSTPVTVGRIPEQRLLVDERITVDAAGYFSDPDDGLTYSAAASPPGIVGLSVEGSRVTIAGLAAGKVTVKVTVTDREGLSASQEFAATVGVSDRNALTALYDETGGEDWLIRSNWLTDAGLGDWHGVDTDEEGRVTVVDLGQNALHGDLPADLGSLSKLQRFSIFFNVVTGPTPVELAQLSELTELDLSFTYLEGPIPPEFGDLSRLRVLRLGWGLHTGTIPASLGNLSNLEELFLARSHWVRERGMTGPIPPELGKLARLRNLDLGMNLFTGTIPPELGNLARLENLDLGMNRLSGPIPPELGQLAGLRTLWLQKNDLSGEFPEELARLGRLEQLYVSGNPNLKGELPSELTALRSLEAFVADGTELCVPTDASFTDWLDGIPKRRVARCEDGNGNGDGAAYLTQAVQSRAFPVPLVAADSALLRVFVTTDNTTGASIPPVRASFYDASGVAVHVVDIPGSDREMPDSVDEGDLEASPSAAIPGRVVQPGLAMVIDVDPDETLDPGVAMPKRIPAEGRMELDVAVMPDLEVTVIPMLWSNAPDSAILDFTDGLTAADTLFWMTRDLLPVGNMKVTVHDPFVSDQNDLDSLLTVMSIIRTAEGGTGHYLGMMILEETGGIAELGGRIAFSTPDVRVIAHEFGHNFNLQHAPCGGASGPDPAFPSDSGATGAWGFNFRSGKLLAPELPDLMSYCRPGWIGDFHFTNALRFRMSDEPASRGTASAERVLLLSGGVDGDGIPFLEPAVAIDAVPSLPRHGGSYRLTGRTADGATLFSLRFGMPTVADGSGGSFFSFAVPVRDAWAGTLASITLSGRGRSDTLDMDTDRPMAILRDAATGQIRRILRELPPGHAGFEAAAALATDPGLEVFFSRGIPSAAELRR